MEQSQGLGQGYVMVASPGPKQEAWQVHLRGRKTLKAAQNVLLFSLSALFSFSWFLKKTGIYKDLKNIHPKQLIERINLPEITKRPLGMGWSSNPA